MSKLLETGQVVEKPTHDSPALLQLAFRPFFLLGSLFSLVSLVLWAAAMTGPVELNVYGGLLWWHVHEMLFGFVAAIVVGFLLTAVQTWTGIPGIKGGWLAALVMLWLGARLAFYFSSLLPPWLIAALDLLFLPLAACVLGSAVLRVRQWRNTIFIAILLAMTVANIAMHLSILLAKPQLQSAAGNGMVMLVTLLMSTMAGRVVPMFTANGTQTPRVAPIPWLETASVVTMLLAVLVSFELPGISKGVTAGCFLLAAFFHGWRALRWRIQVTLGTPLVWPLHVSYWCIPLGLSLYGLSAVSNMVTPSQATHTLTVGAMGMMILAMISRVSLGHTGRQLQVGKIMAGAFMAMFIAFIVRVTGVYWLDSYAAMIVTAVVFWTLAYGCFFLVYLPILSTARLDGRPG